MSSRLSQFVFLRKFQDELTMPFSPSQSSDSSEIRDLAYGWGKILSRRAFGEAGPGLDLDFDSIESRAVDAAHALLQGAVEELLRTQTELLGVEQPCPHCQRPCPVRREPRSVAVRAGTTVQYDEPACPCPACRRDFFPSPPALAARLAQLLSGSAW